MDLLVICFPDLDTCARVGGDPARKLKPDDRLIGSAITCIESGISPAYITIGAAAALVRYLNETEGFQNTPTDAQTVLCEHCKLEKYSELYTLILDMYLAIQAGKNFASLRRKADKLVALTLKNII